MHTVLGSTTLFLVNDAVLSLVIGTYLIDRFYFLPKIFQHLDFKTISNVIEWK